MRFINDFLKECEQGHRLRKIPENNISALNLCSNDYLGLGSKSPTLSEEFLSKIESPFFSSSASRLLSGLQESHLKLENLLEYLYGSPALLFNSGYHANTGIISSLSSPDTLFISDRLIHASAIDGIRLGKANFVRFRHNDLEHLYEIINKERNRFANLILLVESIYSMDGDIAPLKEIVRIKQCVDNLYLYVDEAHAFGVRGEKGLGLSEEMDILPYIDILVGTFGKAAASTGAFCITSSLIKQFLINKARSFIFSTALPPINMEWTIFMIEKILTMQVERSYLKEISIYFKKEIESMTGEKNSSESQIIPLVTRDSQKAVQLSEILLQHNILALPIRRPTVPPGLERIRFSLSADLTRGNIEQTLVILKEGLTELNLS